MTTTRAYIVIFIILISARAVSSQPWYFNNLCNPNNTWSVGLSITSNPAGYMGCAITGDQYNFYQISLIDLQNDGTILNFKNYGQYGRDFWPGENGSFKRDDQNGYYLYGTVDNLNYIVNGFFIYFDTDGDTIFSRKFESLYTTRLAGRNCAKTHDNGFILSGDENILDSSGVDFYIIKIDSVGIEKWRKHYGMNIGDVPYSIIQTPDLGYAIGGLTFSGSQITDDPLIIKTDSLGELEWMLNLGGEYKDDKAMVCNTKDSCIMVLTAYADSMYTPEHAFTRINLVKIDLQGNAIWNKKYGPSKSVNYISNIISLDNGNFIACGYTRDQVYNIAGWLFLFNENGDSLWYREYYYFLDTRGDNLNYLYDVSSTEDGGFIATGQAFTLDPPNNVQKMWVIKVDSIGCEIPNCWVGIEEQGSDEVWGHGGMEAGKQGSMEIFPNPASGEIHVRLNMDDGRYNKDLILSIYNIFGRTASTPTLRQQGEGGEWQVDVSAMPPGIYLAVVREGTSIVGSGKFVVVER